MCIMMLEMVLLNGKAVLVRGGRNKAPDGDNQENEHRGCLC